MTDASQKIDTVDALRVLALELSALATIAGVAMDQVAAAGDGEDRHPAPILGELYVRLVACFRPLASLQGEGGHEEEVRAVADLLRASAAQTVGTAVARAVAGGDGPGYIDVMIGGSVDGPLLTALFTAILGELSALREVTPEMVWQAFVACMGSADPASAPAVPLERRN